MRASHPNVAAGGTEFHNSRAFLELHITTGRASIDVFGDNFLPAYTEGDNRNVVATDTMKNFVYAMALQFQGDRYETFADFLQVRPHTS